MTKFFPTIPLPNRYNLHNQLVLQAADEDANLAVYLLELDEHCHYVGSGYIDHESTAYFLDPEGGPFLSPGCTVGNHFVVLYIGAGSLLTLTRKVEQE